MLKLISDQSPPNASDDGPWFESGAGAVFQPESQQLPRPSAIAQRLGLMGFCGTGNKVPTQSSARRPLAPTFSRYASAIVRPALLDPGSWGAQLLRQSR